MLRQESPLNEYQTVRTNPSVKWQILTLELMNNEQAKDSQLRQC